MSWDSYIDNLIGHSKNSVDKVCIIGLDDGAPWTTAGHANAFKLTATEAAYIAQCFKTKDFSPFMAQGFNAEGTKYQFLREEDTKIVIGKKKDYGAVVMQRSKTAIVIAHCKEGAQAGNTNKAVVVIAEYLESLGM